MQVSYGPHSKVRISSNKSMVKINVLKFGPLSELKKGLSGHRSPIQPSGQLLLNRYQTVAL